MHAQQSILRAGYQALGGQSYSQKEAPFVVCDLAGLMIRIRRVLERSEDWQQRMQAFEIQLA